MRTRKNKSKQILSSLVVLYEHLDKLIEIKKPRPAPVDATIDYIQQCIDKQKKKLKDV